ncbi:MAG TPA: class I SAM-dependent methyltransferase [Solirubrobacteraceae bacterium]|jgi:trans-aconitate 2-methyltransferase|nr:class I SAM-dependent methyltransferase [Solirubrobacteraceae bacterium]
MTVREWDGGVYDRISAPMEALGRAVLDRLELEGDETVIDAGCGSGRVTEALLARLPRGRVIAVDASPSMVAAARERLGEMEGNREGEGLPARLELREGDLLELEVEEPVDAILSTATFHWIADHQRLFARLHAALRPGGRLVAQCGGRGNIDVLRGVANAILEQEPYAAHFRDWRAPWNYAGPEETEERLRASGFQSAECWLQPAPQQPGHPREFLSSIVLGPHYQQLPEDLREPFVDTVLAELGEPVVVDYIRLNIDAVA